MVGKYFVGLMSGTSLDGIDAVVVEFSLPLKLLSTHFLPYPVALKQAILKLQHPSENELENYALLSNDLATLYAQSVNELIEKMALKPNQILAIGCHGQTIRHQPRINDKTGFTLQIGNAALLSELTNITVVSDFRSRDVAAGGQGAPLVPAFHAEVFNSHEKNRAIVNIGGIANITYLPKVDDLSKNGVFGFDSGPGNMLIDAWVNTHLNVDYDKNGAWARTGNIIDALLKDMLSDDFFAIKPPKSTGRDLFNTNWLNQHLVNSQYEAQDVARTLVRLTACTIFDALATHCSNVEEVYISGGGAHNSLLMQDLQHLLESKYSGNILFNTTDAFNIGVDWVEAIAFAWLAKKCLAGETANLPAVTGASSARILGNITQA
jgi:anhydro-N-acetylmuramic acid kinase